MTSNDVDYKSIAVRCSLFAVRCSLFAVRCSLFAVRCSLLAARCSQDIPPLLASQFLCLLQEVLDKRKTVMPEGWTCDIETEWGEQFFRTL
jgi:hypothetical protein